MLSHPQFSTLQSDQCSLGCCEITTKIVRFLQCHNKYWFDHKWEIKMWKNMQHRIVYAYIILWHNQNSNTSLEPNFGVHEKEALRNAEPGENPRVHGPSGEQAHRDNAGRGIGGVWNRTGLFFRPKSGPLGGYPNPLPPLCLINWDRSRFQEISTPCLGDYWHIMSLWDFNAGGVR